MIREIVQNIINFSVLNRKNTIMEVRGSVLVGFVGDEEDHSIQSTGGFDELCHAIEPDELDDVPRLLIKNFKKYTKPSKLFSVFSHFGIVTYLAINGQQAVIEFSNSTALSDILKHNPLMVERAVVKCEILRKFSHIEPHQFQVYLHEELIHLNNKKTFDRFLSDLCNKSNERCKDNMDELCKTIEKYVQHMYPRCKVYLFGSRVTRLCLPVCDLDVFLDCGDMYDGNIDQNPIKQQEIGETVLKQMLKCEEFGRIHKVLHARVPILKFFHTPSGTYGDIAFRNGLGVENSKLLIFLQSLDRRLRPMCLFIKNWARLQGLQSLTEHHHITSYALVIMIVFFLQQLPVPILPPISKLMKAYKGDVKVIAGWPCSFSNDMKCFSKQKNKTSLFELTKMFFQFYQQFPFEWKIISPYLGEAIERRDLDVLASPGCSGHLVAMFPMYVEKLQEEERHTFPTHTPICVQDPFEHSHNLTRNVKEEVLMNFISSCGLMFEKLCYSIE